MASFEARNDENYTKDENGNSNPDYCFNHGIVMFELSCFIKNYIIESICYEERLISTETFLLKTIVQFCQEMPITRYEE